MTVEPQSQTSGDVASNEEAEVKEEVLAAAIDESATPIDERQSHQDINQILGELADIREILQNRLSRDKAKEEAFERLYQELDALKRNKAFEENRPLFIDLILFYDRIEVAKSDANLATKIALKSLQDELREILVRREIEPITTASDVFDARYQKAVDTAKVESLELNGKILRILREGFTCAGAILRPQEVVVGRYNCDPALPDPIETADSIP